MDKLLGEDQKNASHQKPEGAETKRRNNRNNKKGEKGEKAEKFEKPGKKEMTYVAKNTKTDKDSAKWVPKNQPVAEKKQETIPEKK